MHFDLTISMGNIITLGMVALSMFRMDRIASKFLLEHEILIADYCKRMGIETQDLPTRMRGLMR